MAKHAKLLWVDLEMTGLDPLQDRILEVAAIVTDWDFNEIATYEAAVRVDPEVFEARTQVGADFWDKFPEVKAALKAQNESDAAQPVDVVEGQLLEFVDGLFKADEPVLLAGNSIHQDRKFIDNEWPKLAKRLHYRMLDVSAFKVVFDGKYGKRFAKPEEHRAIDDIRGSIMELKYYLGKVRL
jgi:oligoribonuclease